MHKQCSSVKVEISFPVQSSYLAAGSVTEVLLSGMGGSWAGSNMGPWAPGSYWGEAVRAGGSREGLKPRRGGAEV